MYLGEKVDLLLTYVDFKDKKWQADYEVAAHTRVNLAMMERFRSFGTLRYLLRGIDKFMPYIDRLVLIVAYESQVPKWVNRDSIRIVTHDEYINAALLPTFNSCTIESFFYRIPDLNPYIIYTNDDIYPLKESSIDDFFTDGLPNTHFNFYKRLASSNTFRRQCKNGADIIYNRVPKLKENPIFFKPDHCSSALLRDSLIEVGHLCEDEIVRRASPFRNMRNLNQHMYLYYQYFTDKFCDKAIDYKYDTFENSIDSIIDDIVRPKHKFLCLNDSGLTSYEYDNACTWIRNALKTKLPDKCKYEK